MQHLVLIGLFVFKILSKNLILTSIKDRNTVANLLKFELIQAFMHVLVTCKNEEVFGDFSRHSRAANSAVHGQIWSNCELVQDFMIVLVTCKNEEDPIKNEGARVFTTLYIFFQTRKGR